MGTYSKFTDKLTITQPTSKEGAVVICSEMVIFLNND